MKNQYQDDIVFRNVLKRLIPFSILSEIEPDLSRLGDRVTNGNWINKAVFKTLLITIVDILAMSDDVNIPSNYPRLTQYDAWCRRIDHISVSQGWKELNDVAAEEG